MEGRDGTAFHARQGFGLARFPTGAFFCDTNIALIIPPEDTGAGWMKRIILFSRYCRLFDRWGVDARDLGQWENADPAIRQWYQSLMQRDAPNASCCGEADAYWADEIHVRNGKTYVRITNDRSDEPLGLAHIDNGTEVEIPNHKLKWDRSNPTGHGILFLNRNGHVFCYVQPRRRVRG